MSIAASSLTPGDELADTVAALLEHSPRAMPPIQRALWATPSSPLTVTTTWSS